MATETTRSVRFLALLALPALVACSAGAVEESGDIEVLASFYPLQYVVEQVGGDRVSVTNLTPPGADPHSLELSPRQVDDIGSADLVVYLAGLQAATDDAVATAPPEYLVDTAAAAGLTGDPDEARTLDPHFWLDPTRLADVGQQVAEALSAADAEHAQTYRQNAATLETELDALDREYADGLAHCAGATLVVSHEAFGYLADRYDLVQVGISGLNPEAEPSPARLREVAEVVAAADVRTLFFEVLTSPKVTQTLADDLGVATAVLDPVEGQTDPDADYVDVMRANLAALGEGLVCG
ncbi:metal ABC transporter substrate-binding protein [Georgenia sp. MJ170]|uniref:metal ABC transporter substrate-binding protein n=1 Tax=Georgenia sunbinii TaxID=3117728 RepID=UPI002F268265